MLFLHFPLEVLKGLISFFDLFCIIFLHYANFAIVRESKIYFLTNDSDVYPSRLNNRLYSFSNWVINLFNHLIIYLFIYFITVHLSIYLLISSFIYLLVFYWCLSIPVFWLIIPLACFFQVDRCNGCGIYWSSLHWVLHWPFWHFLVSFLIKSNNLFYKSIFYS